MTPTTEQFNISQCGEIPDLDTVLVSEIMCIKANSEVYAKDHDFLLGIQVLDFWSGHSHHWICWSVVEHHQFGCTDKHVSCYYDAMFYFLYQPFVI